MTNAVSYAYFRHRSSIYEKIKGNAGIQFAQFLPMLVRAHHVVWEGWDMVIHHDDEVVGLPYFDVLIRLHEAGLLRLRHEGEAPSLCGAMLWRMLPIFTGEYEYVACRDVDAMPMPRDRKCVEEFIASGMTMHCIHDNASHSGLMGGMIAVNCKQFVDRFSGDLTFSGEGWNVQGKDQNWLNREIEPLVRHSLMIHTSKPFDSDPCASLRQIPPRVAAADQVARGIGVPDPEADAVAPGIGVCDWPSKAFAYYDAMDIPIINKIKEIEQG